MARISERDLILPAVWCLSKAENKTLSTTELQRSLRQIMQPIGEDLEILAGRKDDKFSQKVRNLISHDTLVKLGYATYEKRGKQGYSIITDKGENFLAEQDIEFLDSLLDKKFDYDDVKKAIDDVTSHRTKEKRKQKVAVFDEDAVISEGRKTKVSQKVYARSAKLREAAIQYYSKDGTITCQACKFNFEEVYGELGKGFIEIHHIVPVYAYNENTVEKTIKEALENVIPLCSNCHRMIHKRRDRILQVDELIDIIESTKSKNVKK